MRQFMVGGLVGLPIGINVVQGLVNLAEGKPFGDVTPETVAATAFILVGGVAVLMARYLPDWFNVIEPPPPPLPPITSSERMAIVRPDAGALFGKEPPPSDPPTAQ